ncbi:MAG: hypothetical protein ACOCX5_00050 [Chloroflexota bacterium]
MDVEAALGEMLADYQAHGFAILDREHTDGVLLGFEDRRFLLHPADLR